MEGSNLVAFQAGSQAQAGADLPPGEGSNLVASQATQAGSQAQAGIHLPLGEGSNLVALQATQAGRQAVGQAGSPLPGVIASSQAGSKDTTHPLLGTLPQAGNNLPPSGKQVRQAQVLSQA